jgi:hypothetical protein
MALKDVIKKGSGAPAPADLIVGGIGVDTLNKRLYFKADDGTIVPHDENTPAGNIAATTVQGAINELDIEKASKGANADITSLTALSSINGGQLAGLRNRIINGSAMIGQRGAVALTAAAQYGSDRMLMWVGGGTAITGSISSNNMAGSSSGRGHYLSGTWTNGQPSFIHRIESINCYDLSGKTITISGKFLQNTGSTQNIQVRIAKPSTTVDTFSATTVIQALTIYTFLDNALTSFSATFTLGATDAALGLQVEVYLSTSVSVTSKSFVLCDLQVENGSVPTPFEIRPYGLELSLCQRYYSTSSSVRMSGYHAAGFDITQYVSYPVQMRVAPSVTVKIAGTLLNSTGPAFMNPSLDGYGLVLAAVATGHIQLADYVLQQVAEL